MSDIAVTNLVAKPASPTPLSDARVNKLRTAAMEFEAVFLAEMLSQSGLGAMKGPYSGGVGEDAFASMMTREWADKLAAKGGIGLADRIFEALIARGGDRV